MSLTRMSEFGATSGWLALILPVWLFTEEFRAARLRRLPDRGGGARRAGFGVAVGMTLAGLAAGDVPAAGQRCVGAAACTVVYCLVWFYGLRWLSHRAG